MMEQCNEYCTFGVGKGDKFFNSPFAPMDVTNPKGTPRRPRTRAYTAPNRLLGSENGWPFRRFGGGVTSARPLSTEIALGFAPQTTPS